jgi:hypothetical protein
MDFYDPKNAVEKKLAQKLKKNFLHQLSRVKNKQPSKKNVQLSKTG